MTAGDRYTDGAGSEDIQLQESTKHAVNGHGHGNGNGLHSSNAGGKHYSYEAAGTHDDEDALEERPLLEAPRTGWLPRFSSKQRRGQGDEPLRIGRARRSCWLSRRATILTGTALALYLAVHAVLWSLFLQPPYHIPPREQYITLLDTFRRTKLGELPAKSEAWMKASQDQLEAARQQIQAAAADSDPGDLRRRIADAAPFENSVETEVPATVFSSDRAAAAPQEWATSWSELGFHPATYLDDPAADRFMAARFGPLPEDGVSNSSTMHAWHALPRGVMRADFLRYMLLLTEGGTWSDMDVEPLKPFAEWTSDVHRLPPADAEQPQPIRLVVGMECEPVSYTFISARGWLERLRLLPLVRHRNVQFVQWTLHAAAGHPILLDVLRRLVEADELFTAYKIKVLREAMESGAFTALPASAKSTQGVDYLQELALAQKKNHPWIHVRRVFRWISGAWRVTFHELSVEEWTGPAVWTDCVFSYLHAVYDLRPTDLYGLDKPVQIGDVLVAPVSWFNPKWGRKGPRARVLHHYRGSWKNGGDSV